MRFPLILAVVLLLASVTSSAKAMSVRSVETGTSGQIVLPSDPPGIAWSKEQVTYTLEKSPESAAATKTLAGIKVYFALADSGRVSVSARDAVTTDAQGNFRFPKKLPDNTLLLIVPPPALGDISAFSGIAPNAYASVTFARIRKTKPNIFLLDRATQIQTTVIDHNRKPFVGNSISFWPADGLQNNTTPLGIFDLPEELKPLLSAVLDVGGECHLFGMAQNKQYVLIADLYPKRFIPLVLSQTIKTQTSHGSDIPPFQIFLKGITSKNIPKIHVRQLQ